MSATRCFIVLFVMAGFFQACSNGTAQDKAQTASSSTLPNIILIVADDLGYPYAGFMGDTIVKTPNLDRLASAGTVFRNGMVTANHCAPSLRTIITGLHSYQYNKRMENLREQVRTEKTEGLSKEDSIIWEKDFKWKAMPYFNTLPKMLAAEQYASFQGGKWWEFNYQNGGFTHGMSTGWTKEDRQTDSIFYKFMGNAGLALGRVTNQPVFDFIDAHREQPFMVWYAPDLPHFPLDAPDKYYNKYKDLELSESAKRYYANISWFDDNIGAIRNHIEQKGLLENTLFIYVNDNGWEQPPQAEYRNDPLLWHNGGDKGKISYYDQSFHTPLFFTLSGKIPAAQVKSELVSSMDILPTVLDYVGIESPAYLPGRSLRTNIEQADQAEGYEHLIGNFTQLRDRADMMGKKANGYWMRTPNYHFVWDVLEEQVELYDMQKDPNNDHNIAAELPAVVHEMKEQIEAWKQEMAASIATIQ
ncbi:MAG: sulfatase-like hydrolase/transferase [Bacteroidota bacterium]